MTDPNILDVYDMEPQLEAAIASVLTAGGLKACTPLTVKDFQTERPRYEVVFKVGSSHPKGSTGQRQLMPQTQIQRDVAWRGEFSVICVTDSEQDSKQSMGYFRAKLRYLQPLLPILSNGVLLPYHNIQFVTETGTTPTYSPEDGLWLSSIMYAIDFSINNSALKLLD